MKANTLFASAVILAAQGVMAEDSWKNSVELGLVLTSGNTETQSINTKGAVEKTSGKLRNSASLEALNVKGTVDGRSARLAEKYAGGAKTAYLYTQHSYTYIGANGEHDPFSGYSYQTSATLGYGYRAVTREQANLDLEVGVGYRQLRKRTETDPEKDFIGRLAVKGIWNFSKSASLSEELGTEGKDYWITKSVTALTSKMNSNLSMKLSLTIKNNPDAPSTAKETDSETAATVVYNF